MLSIVAYHDNLSHVEKGCFYCYMAYMDIVRNNSITHTKLATNNNFILAKLVFIL